MSSENTGVSILEGIKNADNKKVYEESWRRFVEIYGPLIRGWAERDGADANDADDIQQQVLEIAYKSLPHFVPSGRPGALRRWLRVTVAHQMIRLRRKRSHEQAPGGSDFQDRLKKLEDDASEVSHAWDAEYQHDLVQRLLAMVSNDFEANTIKAFIRAFLEGKPIVEVAEELHCTENAVRVSQSKVLSRLREIGQDLIEIDQHLLDQ